MAGRPPLRQGNGGQATPEAGKKVGGHDPFTYAGFSRVLDSMQMGLSSWKIPNNSKSDSQIEKYSQLKTV
jgi:hypothetical protein